MTPSQAKSLVEQMRSWRTVSVAAVVALLAGCEPEKPPSTRIDAPVRVTSQGDAIEGEREEVAAEAKPARESKPAGETTSRSTLGEREKTSSGSSDRVVAKTFDDIKFDIEPDTPFDRSMLTRAIEDLDGERIRIRGYILPTPRRAGLKSFVLVRDNLECCFGPGAALYDCILVEMEPGETAEFSSFPVAVEGRFAVEEFIGPDDKTLAIYRMEGESVER